MLVIVYFTGLSMEDRISYHCFYSRVFVQFTNSFYILLFQPLAPVASQCPGIYP